MPDPNPDEFVHQLAAATDDASDVPWDRGAPHPMLVGAQVIRFWRGSCLRHERGREG